MINVPNVQVSDTTKADRYSADGQQKNSNKKAIESSTAFQFYKKGAISYFHKIVYDPAQ
jgi:hypothetical protein